MRLLTTPDLDTVDIEALDLYERREYERMRRRGMKKERILQILVNMVEGDFTQLSEQLMERAEMDVSWK